MRFARLAGVLLALLGTVSTSITSARADVLHQVLAAGASQAAGTPPPAQSTDLSAWAGEARATTLPELLKLTVQQSPALQSAKLDIAIAEAQIQQTWARNDWRIAASLQGTRSSGEFAGVTTTVTGSADISRLLPTGGTIGLHADSTYSRNSGAKQQVPTSLDPDGVIDLPTFSGWSSNLGLVVSQPLLRGFGRDVFDANERRAVLSRDAAVLTKRLVAIQTVQTVISAYWDLVLAERSVAITQGSLDLARERLRVTQIGADGGKIPRSEIPAVLQIIATREEEVLNQELGVLDRSIALRRAAGLPIGAGELGLRVATDLGPQDRALDLGQLVERAYGASPELARLAKQDASTVIQIEVTESGLLPQLDAALSIGPTGSAEKFADAWKDTAKFKDVAAVGSLTFSQSIGRNGVKGLVREQRETRRKLMVNAVDVRAQLAQGMTQAVSQVELARRRVTLSQRAIDLANENIKIETDRFNLGKSTNFDVLNRQEDLRQAELRKTQALIDWHKAEIVVQALTGDILPAYGITVE